MLLGILSSVWNIVRENKKNYYATNKNIINERKETDIDTSIQMSK